MENCALCEEHKCCPEHCCDWDECECGDCDACTTKTLPPTSNAPTIKKDTAKIINLAATEKQEEEELLEAQRARAAGAGVFAIRALKRSKS